MNVTFQIECQLWHIDHISLKSWHPSLFFVGSGLLCSRRLKEEWFSFFLTWHIWKIRNQQRTTKAHPSKFKCISTEQLSFLLPDFGQHPVFNFFWTITSFQVFLDNNQFSTFFGQQTVFNFFWTTTSFQLFWTTSNIQVFLDNIQFSTFFLATSCFQVFWM